VNGLQKPPSEHLRVINMELGVNIS